MQRRPKTSSHLVRRLRVEDGDTYAALGRHNDVNGPAYRLVDVLSGNLVWGAFAGDNIVGVAHVGHAVQVDQPGTLWGMFVRPDYRRQGIASALLASIQTATTSRLQLFVEPGNGPAVTLYLRHGFEIVERNETTIVMASTVTARGSTATRC